jgi:hypothetical protein
MSMNRTWPVSRRTPGCSADHVKFYCRVSFGASKATIFCRRVAGPRFARSNLVEVYRFRYFGDDLIKQWLLAKIIPLRVQLQFAESEAIWKRSQLLQFR